MRRLSLLLALVIAAPLFFLASAAPAKAIECTFLDTEAACYCRFKTTDPRLACRGETTKLKEVCIDASTASAAENAACASDCTAAGYDPLNNSSNEPKGVRPLTDQYCDFDPNNCGGVPRNATQVAGCFRCFCKYKAGTQPVQCVGRTTLAKYTAYQGSCEAYCQLAGFDSAGNAGQYESQCDYRTSDNCAKPLNPEATGCKDIAAANAGADFNRQTVTNRGSVVGLSLPLSNIKLEAFIGRVIRAIVGLVGTIALVMFIWGGLQWMLAAGDATKVAAGKKTITWATLGIFAIASAYAILNFIINAIRK